MTDPRSDNAPEPASASSTPTSKEAAPETARASSGARRVWIAGLALILLLGLAGAGLVFGPRILDQPPDDLWAEATYEPDPDCEAGSPECPVFIEPFPIGHGGSGSETGLTMMAVTYPRLDDPIAQWGQCMDTVLTCVRPASGETADARAAQLRSCVAQSACPPACRERYAARAGTDLETAHGQFLEIFVEEDAWCAPRQ